MEGHIKTYLANSSVHGFNRLVQDQDGSTRWFPRLCWLCAIITSFSCAGYLVWISAKEIADSPVVTSVEYVPVQGVPFMSLTLATEEKAFPFFKWNIMNQLSYDCHKADNAALCLKESSSARKIVQPLAEFLMTSMFNQYMETVADDERTVEKFARHFACDAYTSGSKFFNQLMESLSVPNEQLRNHNLHLHINKVAELFKTPGISSWSNLTEYLRNYVYVKMDYAECLASHFDDSLSSEAKAMFLLVYKTIIADESTLGIGHYHKMSTNPHISMDTSSKVTFKENIDGLKIQIMKGMNNLVDEDDVTFVNILEFLNLYDTVFDFGSDLSATLNGTFMSQHYGKLLRVAKYSMPPLQSRMTETSRVKDMEGVLKSIDGAFGRSEPESFINYYPALLYCQFGDQKDNKMCHEVATTFTTSGLGYTFNLDIFFQHFKRGPMMEIFCYEFNERTNQKMCSDQEVGKKKVSIRANGPRSSLKLLLNIPQKGKNDWSKKKITIHSSHSIADTFGHFIEPSPGTHSTLIITPHETVTDKELLEKDISVRKCHYQVKDGNPLKIFQNYTRDNCVFECQLEKSMKQCGCVPWNYPLMDQDVPICSYEKSWCFHEAMREAEESSQCPECLEECSKVNYEFTVHTKPLGDICSDEEVSESVNTIINDQPINYLPGIFLVQDLSLESHLHSPCTYYVQRNAALVEFQIGPSRGVRTTRRARVTDSEKLANIGGTLSLFTGTSFLTLFEFLMFIMGTLEILGWLFWDKIKEYCLEWWRRRNNHIPQRRESRLYERVARRVNTDEIIEMESRRGRKRRRSQT